MPTDKPPREGIKETARDSVVAAYQRTHGRRANRSSARMRADAGRIALALADAGSERASNAGDMFTYLGVLMLRTAVTVADDLIGAAEELDSRFTGLSGQRRSDEPSGSAGVSVSAAPTLKLPDTSPGSTVEADFIVRNDSLDTVDAMRLRCTGLFATGGLRIPGHNVKFAPPLVDVPAHSRAFVTCSVNAPRSTKRGHYVGPIEATNLPDVGLLVALNVV